MATDASPAWLNKQFEAARKAESGGRYREAVKCYEEILRRDPTVSQAYNNLGLDFYRLKEYEKAAGALRKGLKIKPDMLSAGLFLGFADFNVGNFEESEKVLSTVVKSHPENRRARLFLIRDQTGLDRFDLNFSQQTLDMFPGDIEVNYTIGTAVLQRMRWIADYANKLGVQSPMFQWISLRIDKGKGDLVSAQKWQEQLQKEGATQPPPLVHEYDELAIMIQHCFQTVLNSASNSAEGYDLQGQIDEARGRLSQALAEYGKSGDHFAAGRLLAQNFHLPEAAKELEEAVAAQPENKLAAALLAKVYVQEHQPDRALPVLRKLLKEFPQDAYAWRDLGKAQFDLGQTNEAVQSLRVAVRLNPSLYRIHFELAMAYRELGQTQLEKEEIEKFRSGSANRQMQSAPASQN